VRVGKKRIERLMRENGIQGRRKRRFKHTADSNHGGPIARNLLARQFRVAEPNRAWVTDVTAITTGEGWLYLAPMLDLCSRRVVGWAASDSNDTELALDVLRKALRARKPPPDCCITPTAEALTPVTTIALSSELKACVEA
jgi:putative transposase